MGALAIVLMIASSVAAVQTPLKLVPKPAPAPSAPTQKPPATPAPPNQKPPAPGTVPATAPASAVTPAAKPATEAYTYDPENRRDPFVNLLGTGGETAVVKKGDGPAAMLVAEISVRGIMQSKGAYVAVVEGSDKKTYIVHSGDKFADGTIKTIMPTGLVIIQDVNDPLSLVKQREVRKLLRSLEDAKQ
jgi:hypothetical protein